MHFLFKKKQQPQIVQPHHQIKIVMLACETGGSGKTCLAKSIIGEPFQQSTQITQSGYFQKQFQKNKEIYKINIWDTNSHQKYRSVLGLYLKPSIYNCFVITVNPQYFSIDSFKSFLKYLLSVNNDALIILCQSFSDLQQQINEDLEIVKQIFKEQFKYFKVSSKTGQNVKQLRNFIVNYFHNLTQKLHQRYNPKYSQNFLKSLEELSNSIEHKLLKKISQLEKQNQIYRLKLIQHNQDPNQLIKHLRRKNNQKSGIQFINIRRQENPSQINHEQQNTHQQLQKNQEQKIINQLRKQQQPYHYYENSNIQNNEVQDQFIEHLLQNVKLSCFPKGQSFMDRDSMHLSLNSQNLSRDSFQEIIRQKYPHKLTQYQVKQVSQLLEAEAQQFSLRSDSISSQNSISIAQVIQEAQNTKVRHIFQ